MTFERNLYEVPPVKTNYSKAGVFHTIDGTEVYPDVKKVTRLFVMDYINEWRERVGQDVADETMNKAIANSKEVRDNIKHYLTNGDSYVNNTTERGIKLFKLYKPYLDRITDIRLHGSVVYNDDYCVAGSVECIAKFNGIPAIIMCKLGLHDKQDEWLEQYHAENFVLLDAFNKQFNTDIKTSIIIYVSQDGNASVFTSRAMESSLKEFMNFREVLFNDIGI